MIDARAFRGFRFPAEVVLWAVRWYLRFPVSYRDLELMLADRGRRGRPRQPVPLGAALRARAREAGAPAPAPLPRAVARRRDLRPRGRGLALPLPAPSTGPGQTVDFLLSATRDKKAAKRFFRKALGRDNTRNPREIVTDRLKSYPGALREMKRDGELWRFTRHRRGRWLNNRVEQDHRRVKRLTRPMLGFGSFRTARRTLAGVEAMAMLAKGQVRAVPGTTCRRSGPSSPASSASPPERRGAGQRSPAVSQRNEASRFSGMPFRISRRKSR
jgi:transposase-like protein